MGFPRQECWSGLPFPSPEDLPDPRIEPKPYALAGGFFTTEPPGKPLGPCDKGQISKLCPHHAALSLLGASNNMRVWFSAPAAPLTSWSSY